MRIWNAAAGTVLGIGMAVAAFGGAGASAQTPETREPLDARLAWWLEARFGMFIH